MRKAKFLGLALAAAITLTGAGYAYWNDNVTISTTVLTGKVKTAFDPSTAKTSLTFNNNDESDNGTVATGKVELSNNNKTAAITLNNLYPGAHTTATLTIDNTSSIPVKLDALTFVPTTPADKNPISLNDVTVSAKLTVENLGTYELGDVLNTTAVNQKLQALKAYNIPANSDITIELTVDVPAGTEGSQNGGYSISITPTFLQFNK